MPNLVPDDDLYDEQWHLHGTWGINVESVWDDWRGEGVYVAVFDDGVQGSHPDLVDAYDTSLDYNVETGAGSAFPIYSSDNHGTAVAGIIAAAADGDGVVGVAFEASLISIYQDYVNPVNPDGIVDAIDYAAQVADVMSNSWGFASPYLDNFDDLYFLDGIAVENAAENGRDGLGTILVFSAGNLGEVGSDTNYHNFDNSRFVVTVGAIDPDGMPSSFTTPGSTVLIAAGGDFIVTTDRTGNNGYVSGDYIDTFDGTSAATPIVAGVVALMLDANPDLGWRDVQEILALTARQTVDVGSYQFNGAANWNGGGLHFSDFSGSGLVDAHAAVRLAETWERQGTSDNELVASATASGGFLNDGATLARNFSISSSIVVERIELDVDAGTHSYAGDFQVLLTSPSGMQGLFVPSTFDGYYEGTWTYGSVQFLGENSAGTWSVSITDMAGGDVGTLGSFALRVYGHAVSVDDLYVYTDEFGEMEALHDERASLSDGDGGVDTLNASAVSTGMTINLAGGSSTIDGTSLDITTQTIERIFSGDGNDHLTGGTAANFFDAGRGLDRLYGGAGADTLGGNAGGDTMQGDAGADVLIGDWEGDSVGSSDTLYGGLDGDYLAGGAGSDLSYGEGAADWLDGGSGNDVQRGGDGDDVVDGGRDNDTLYGEAGADVVLGGLGNDLAYGGDLADWLDGGADNDRLYGDVGADQVHMGGGRDTAFGGADADTLFGGDGNDHAYGDDGNDTIEGGNGLDTILGGAGNDWLFGGVGPDSDVFVFTMAGTGQDTIFDFQHDTDVLDFTAFGFANFAAYQTAGGLLGAVDASGFQLVGVSGAFALVHALNGVSITADDFLFQP